jgi:hypothetical protein
MCLYFLFGGMMLLVFIVAVLCYRVFNLEQSIKNQISTVASKDIIDTESKRLMSQRFSEIKFSIVELEEKVRLRTSLVLDRMDDLNRICLKKEEFDRIFELIRREKIILDNAIENNDKKKWDNYKMAFGGKKEQQE